MYKEYPVIGLCMVRADDERNFMLIEALAKKIHAAGARLIIYQATTNMYWQYKPEGGERMVYSLVNYDYVDAMIVFTEIINDDSLNNEIIQNAKAHNKPVFTIGKPMPGCVNFGFLYTDGIEKAIRHVYEKHNCRQFCFVAGPEGEPTSEARIRKYKEVITGYGLDSSLNRIYYGGYWSTPALKAAQKILDELNPLPEAIICANDLMAIALADFFKEHGIRVPQDIILTGLDATIESQANVPSITTSGCDMDELADMIVSAFQKAMKGEPLEKEYLCHFTLIEGQSCGCKESMISTELSSYLKYNIAKQNEKLYVEQCFHAIYEKILGSPDIRQIPEILSSMTFCETLEVIVNEDSLRNNVNPLAENYRKGFDNRMKVLYQSGRNTSELPVSIRLSDLAPNLEELFRPERPIMLSPLSFFSRAVGYLVYSPEVTNQNYYMVMPYTNSLSEIVGSYSMVRHLEFNALQLDRMARHDPLTDLYNRNGFYTRLPILVDQSDAPLCAVTTADMDGLKTINDRYGHEAGDLAIRYVARAVASATGDNAICGRFGGDEFVICSTIHNEDEVQQIHNRIHDFLTDHMSKTSLPIPITASVGTCVMTKEEFDFDAALKVSDERMYQEKSGKKNRRTE